MSIPFTQYLLPDGRKSSVSIDRPAEVEELAKSFLERGGRFECEVLTTGEVSLTAVAERDGEEQDIDIELCPNGPSIPSAVDALVRRVSAVF